MLDVGAYLGTVGLGLMARRRRGFLYAVEANPAITPLLAAEARAEVAEAQLKALGLPPPQT